MKIEKSTSEYDWCLEEVKKLNLEIRYLAEIGSRDGLDAIKLSKEFNPIETYIFEADPYLSENINKNIDKAEKKMNLKLFNIALGSEDKEVKFYAVDRKKYAAHFWISSADTAFLIMKGAFLIMKQVLEVL